MISNGSALVSEEKGPSLVSEYASLAPEEVGGKSKGQFKIKAERTAEEIKRDRRQIKQKIKGHGYPSDEFTIFAFLTARWVSCKYVKRTL